MTFQRLDVFPFPPPDASESAALQTASQYLKRTGIHASTYLLGFPYPNVDIDLLADLCQKPLGSAALCESVLELVDDQHGQ